MQDLDGTTSYVYDNLYRLTQVTYPGGEQVTYAYDPMGNRTSLTSTVSGATSYTYDAADRLLTAGATSFAWDANGRMTGKGSATYTYDALDRLTQVVSGATTVAVRLQRRRGAAEQDRQRRDDGLRAGCAGAAAGRAGRDDRRADQPVPVWQ